MLFSPLSKWPLRGEPVASPGHLGENGKVGSRTFLGFRSDVVTPISTLLLWTSWPQAWCGSSRLLPSHWDCTFPLEGLDGPFLQLLIDSCFLSTHFSPMFWGCSFPLPLSYRGFSLLYGFLLSICREKLPSACGLCPLPPRGLSQSSPTVHPSEPVFGLSALISLCLK